MKKGLLAAVICALFLSACTTPGKRTAIGAGAGAAAGALAGAVIANNTGGKSGQGAVYGALAGAALGGGIGNYLDKQAKELAAIADVSRTADGGIVVTLKNEILFDTNSAVLSSEAGNTLLDLNRVLKKYPSNVIVVEGYTDSTGTAEYNKKLSEQRAKAVYDFIVDNGLKTSSISYVGYGINNPVADNSTEAGRAKNRRVQLNITAPKK